MSWRSRDQRTDPLNEILYCGYVAFRSWQKFDCVAFFVERAVQIFLLSASQEGGDHFDKQGSNG